MDITRRDWMGQPTIEERLSPEVSFMEYGGVAYSGTTTGTFAALIGSAPGTTPDFHGSVENHEGLALLGQSQLNAMVGHLFANANSPFPTVSMDLSINAANLDIAPQETVGLHIAREDTVRNLAIDGLYLPDSMSWNYTPEGFMLLTSIDFKQLVNGIEGETVVIPIDPATGDVGGGFNVPGLQVPQVPSLSLPAFGAGGVTSYILMTADSDSFGLPDFDLARAVGEFAGYAASPSIVIPSNGLYLISFWGNFLLPDNTPPDTVFFQLKEFDASSGEVNRAYAEFINFSSPSTFPDGRSFSVLWYVLAGHSIQFSLDSAIELRIYSHGSITKLSNF
jgi:hypothetical protein